MCFGKVSSARVHTGRCRARESGRVSLRSRHLPEVREVIAAANRHRDRWERENRLHRVVGHEVLVRAGLRNGRERGRSRGEHRGIGGRGAVERLTVKHYVCRTRRAVPAVPLVVARLPRQHQPHGRHQHVERPRQNHLCVKVS